MDVKTVRKWVLKNFQLNGYSVRAEAAAYLASQLAPLEEPIRHKWMGKVIQKIQELNLSSLAIDKEHLEVCLEECTRKQPSSETVFNVISAFEIPKFRFDPEKNKFLKDTSAETKLFASAPMKSEVYRRRYSIILQRTQRHELFRKRAFGESGQLSCQLRTAESFLCSSGRIPHGVMLGLLVKRGAGLYQVEDPTGFVRLDLTECKFPEGIITEHCFVLAEGAYEDKVLYAIWLSIPPAERALISRPYFGNANTFGGPSETPLSESVSLYKIQMDNPDAMIVFLSDVWLDDIKVMTKLKALFEGFESCPPVAFVLLGNFLSLQAGAKYADRLKLAFRSLADAISSVSSVAQKSHVVLVPGPSDPGSPYVFPRPPLPDHLVEELRKKVPHLVVATNPCRVQYCTREILVIREDLLTKMSRNAIHFPTTCRKFPSHFTRTIVCNATVAPLSLYNWPVHWAYAHAMDLYPLPDLVVIGDQFNSFITEYCGCQITNPGSFRRNGFSFHVYYPARNKNIEPPTEENGDSAADNQRNIEECSVPDAES